MVAENVERYLRELQTALAGADPALIQDALFDAEEHLRSEMVARGFAAVSGGTAPAEAAAFAAVAEAYGSPQEVATAYLDAQEFKPYATTGRRAPIATTPGDPDAVATAQAVPPGEAAASPPWWKLFFGVVTDASAYKALFYMLLSLGTGIAYFTVVVTGLSTSAGLIILIIGIPFLLLFLGVVRGLSFLEGRLIETLLETRMPRRPRPEIQSGGFFQRILFWVTDGRTWLAMAFMVLMLPLGICYFSIVVSGFGAALWMIAVPFVQLATGHTYVNYDSLQEFIFPVWSLPLMVIGGALLFVISLHIIRLIGRGHAAFAKVMLVRPAK
ncbi:MAG: hypothetical protein GXY46_09760 [Actinobacteria bacterium]|nr:hypothetical protein [Actinomycetota bacterium]